LVFELVLFAVAPFAFALWCLRCFFFVVVAFAIVPVEPLVADPEAEVFGFFGAVPWLWAANAEVDARANTNKTGRNKRLIFSSNRLTGDVLWAGSPQCATRSQARHAMEEQGPCPEPANEPGAETLIRPQL
jgi:hypothetical protein